MTTVDEHAAWVRSLLSPLSVRPRETVPLDEALGRVTVGPVLSPVALPLFRNSQMDGYAVRAVDVARAPVRLWVAGEVVAGPATPRPLEAGTAVRIMTGAVIPEGADAIVPVEDTEMDADHVQIARARSVGEYVREAGSDLAADAELVPAGLRLASRHLGALAAAGIRTIEVRSRLRVAVISTGSELAALGAEPAPGEIYDSNGVALAAAVTAVDAELVGHSQVRDDPAQLLAVLEDAVADGAELILTSGGISMGDHEVVRELLEPLGASVGAIAMQPGGPQALASFQGVPVVCFPGNPVSSQLSFELFVAPVLRELAGLPPAVRATRVLDGAVRSVPGKRQFLRGRRIGAGRVATVSGASSHLVAGLAASDLLIDIPADVTELAAGATVETWEL